MTYAELNELPDGNNVALVSYGTLDARHPDNVALLLNSAHATLGVHDAMILREGLDRFIAEAVGAHV